jgi:hypothetical protein
LLPASFQKDSRPYSVGWPGLAVISLKAVQPPFGNL